MVSNIEIYPLIRIVWNLGFLQERVSLATGLLATTNVQVKGENGLFSGLEGIKYGIEKLERKYEEVSNIPAEIQKWLDVFETDYGDPKAFVTRHGLYLSRKHAEKLFRDLEKWRSQVFSIYEKPNTKTLNEKELREMVKDLFTKLDDDEKKDLMDGYSCIVNNIPTPGAMILYRVGESMVKKFYVKEMQHEPPENSTMGTMAKELRDKQVEEINQKKRSKADPLVNYILHQTEDRNLAQHPERRFNQTEVEDTFTFIKRLINDIHERLQEK